MAAEVKAKRRVQLDLTENSMKRLLDLKERTEFSSFSEVFKNALRLYEVVINDAQEGNKFFVKRPSGEVIEYCFFN